MKFNKLCAVDKIHFVLVAPLSLVIFCYLYVIYTVMLLVMVLALPENFQVEELFNRKKTRSNVSSNRNLPQ